MENILIFDCDGVIIDSLDIFMKNFMSACKKNGFNQISTKETFIDLFDGNLYEKMIETGIDKEKLPCILEDLKKGLLSDQDKVSLFEGIKSMFEELSKENKIIIVTSSVTKAVEELLKSKDLSCFDEVIGADKEISKVKKIEGVKESNLNCQYFYIGDTRGDMVEGRKAGARTIAITWGWHSEERLKQENPDYIIHSPMELVNLFKSPTNN